MTSRFGPILSPVHPPQGQFQVLNTYAYVADWGGGVRVIDVSTPSAAVEVGYFEGGGAARGIHLAGDVILMTDEDTGILKLQNMLIPTAIKPAPARQTMLRQNYPNPFNPTTTIQFTLPSRQPVRLTIYDVAGRRVRQLVDGVMSEGDHTVVWDGTRVRRIAGRLRHLLLPPADHRRNAGAQDGPSEVTGRESGVSARRCAQGRGR